MLSTILSKVWTVDCGVAERYREEQKGKPDCGHAEEVGREVVIHRESKVA